MNTIRTSSALENISIDSLTGTEVAEGGTLAATRLPSRVGWLLQLAWPVPRPVAQPLAKQLTSRS